MSLPDNARDPAGELVQPGVDPGVACLGAAHAPACHAHQHAALAAEHQRPPAVPGAAVPAQPRGAHHLPPDLGQPGVGGPAQASRPHVHLHPAESRGAGAPVTCPPPPQHQQTRPREVRAIWAIDTNGLDLVTKTGL